MSRWLVPLHFGLSGTLAGSLLGEALGTGGPPGGIWSQATVALLACGTGTWIAHQALFGRR